MTKTQVSILSMISLLVVGGSVVGISSAITASQDRREAEAASMSDVSMSGSETQEAGDAPVIATGDGSLDATETDAPPVGTQAPTQGVTPTQAPATQPAPETTTKITWEYDAELSKQVAECLIAKRPELVYDTDLFVAPHPENFVKENEVVKTNNIFIIIQEFSGSNVAQQIVDAWWPNVGINPVNSPYTQTNFCVGAYRYSNGLYYVALC